MAKRQERFGGVKEITLAKGEFRQFRDSSTKQKPTARQMSLARGKPPIRRRKKTAIRHPHELAGHFLSACVEESSNSPNLDKKDLLTRSHRLEIRIRKHKNSPKIPKRKYDALTRYEEFRYIWRGAKWVAPQTMGSRKREISCASGDFFGVF